MLLMSETLAYSRIVKLIIGTLKNNIAVLTVRELARTSGTVVIRSGSSAYPISKRKLLISNH